jgi:hypothetical protein
MTKKQEEPRKKKTAAPKGKRMRIVYSERAGDKVRELPTGRHTIKYLDPPKGDERDEPRKYGYVNESWGQGPASYTVKPPKRQPEEDAPDNENDE